MEMKELAEAFRKALVEVLIPEVNRLTGEMQVMREEMNQRFDAMQIQMDQRFDAMQIQMDQRFEAMQKQMDQRFEAMQIQMDQRFEAMQERSDKRFEAMQHQTNERFEAANDRFASLEKSLAVVIAQGEEHQKLTKQVLERLDVRERVAKLEIRAETERQLRTSFRVVRQDVATLKTQVAALSERIRG